MGKLLALCIVAFAFISIGSALQCLKCSFTFFDLPCHTTTVTCKEKEVCATIRGRAAGHKLILKRNCVEEERCSKNFTDTFAGINYVTTYTCCDGDFCNSGALRPSAAFSLPVALAVLGAWALRFL